MTDNNVTQRPALSDRIADLRWELGLLRQLRKWGLTDAEADYVISRHRARTLGTARGIDPTENSPGVTLR